MLRKLGSVVVACFLAFTVATTLLPQSAYAGSTAETLDEGADTSLYLAIGFASLAVVILVVWLVWPDDGGSVAALEDTIPTDLAGFGAEIWSAPEGGAGFSLSTSW